MIYLLSKKEYSGATNLPVILTKNFTLDIDISHYEALIFSSKNGVLALEANRVKWRDIPVYSIGSGTSSVIKELGGNLVYEARNSYGDSFADEIKERLSGSYQRRESTETAAGTDSQDGDGWVCRHCQDRRRRDGQGVSRSGPSPVRLKVV